MGDEAAAADERRAAGDCGVPGSPRSTSTAPLPARADARIRPTRLEEALDWAQALAPSPLRIATGCCGMSIVSGGDPFESLGTGPPATAARQADLLIVAGTLTRRQAPLVRTLYERMVEPRWVIAWGACAISGGAYANYATVHGLARIVPVDLVVPGCPPPVTALREALEWLRSGRARGAPSLRGARSGREASSGEGEWPILRDEGHIEVSGVAAVGGPIEAPDARPVYGSGASATPAERASASVGSIPVGRESVVRGPAMREGNEDVDRD